MLPNPARRWQNCLKSDAFLSSATPADWPVDASWQTLVSHFFESTCGRQLSNFINERLKAGAHIYPPQPLRALQCTPLTQVRVVILGQDPYHGLGQAEGLAFSVQSGVAPPPSLRNIFKELTADLGLQPPMSGSLLAWAQRGVLLLNTCLTVEDGLPASHAKQGWEALTDEIIQAIAESTKACVFMLWGAHAQSKAQLIAQTAIHNPSSRLLLQANHPSPLSALRGPQAFIGCGHFSKAQQWLESKGIAMDWSLEN